MIIWCSWHDAQVGEKQPFNDLTVTHTICLTCREAQKQKATTLLRPLRFPKIFPSCDICQKEDVTHTVDWNDEDGVLIKQFRICTGCVREVEEVKPRPAVHRIYQKTA